MDIYAVLVTTGTIFDELLSRLSLGGDRDPKAD